VLLKEVTGGKEMGALNAKAQRIRRAQRGGWEALFSAVRGDQPWKF